MVNYSQTDAVWHDYMWASYDVVLVFSYNNKLVVFAEFATRSSCGGVYSFSSNTAYIG